MNKILKLFDQEFVQELFKDNVLPLYPSFFKIKKIKIGAPKKNIWEQTYHVVIEYRTTFITNNGKEKKVRIYCSAHSEEPRKNVYKALSYLWDNGFGKGYLTIPRPLFYSDYFRGTFYRGVEGHNLYNYIRENKRREVEAIVSQAAIWFSKLHHLPASSKCNFNIENSRIKTVVPGREHILSEVKVKYPRYYDVYRKAYDVFIKNEEEFLANTNKLCLIHGDAHPENIIKMGQKKIAGIDFTDICLSDFARDLGCFQQQLEFMITRKLEDNDFAKKTCNLFLDTYLKNSKIELNSFLQERIDNYYNWTTMRTATFFLTKDKSEPERAVPLIKKVKNNLEI